MKFSKLLAVLEDVNLYGEASCDSHEFEGLGAHGTFNLYVYEDAPLEINDEEYTAPIARFEGHSEGAFLGLRPTPGRRKYRFYLDMLSQQFSLTKLSKLHFELTWNDVIYKRAA